MTTSDEALLADLRRVLGDRVRADSAERALLRRDASVFEGGSAGPTCLCESTEEVQQVVQIALAHDRAVVPRGAGTGLAGGAIPLGSPVVVSLSRMNRILEVDTEARIAWVEPGAVNLDLTKYLTPLGYHFAPDPSSQQVSTIGGNVGIGVLNPKESLEVAGNIKFADKIFSSDYDIPTQGTWTTGSVVWNNKPAVGLPVGWVCIKGGTPGSWRPFGLIN